MPSDAIISHDVCIFYLKSKLCTFLVTKRHHTVRTIGNYRDEDEDIGF